MVMLKITYEELGRRKRPHRFYGRNRFEIHVRSRSFNSRTRDTIERDDR